MTEYSKTRIVRFISYYIIFMLEQMQQLVLLSDEIVRLLAMEPRGTYYPGCTVLTPFTYTELSIWCQQKLAVILINLMVPRVNWFKALWKNWIRFWYASIITDFTNLPNFDTGSRGHPRRDVVVCGGDGVRRPGEEARVAGGRGGGGPQRHARVQGRGHPGAQSHVGKSFFLLFWAWNVGASIVM